MLKTPHDLFLSKYNTESVATSTIIVVSVVVTVSLIVFTIPCVVVAIIVRKKYIKQQQTIQTPHPQAPPPQNGLTDDGYEEVWNY